MLNAVHDESDEPHSTFLAVLDCAEFEKLMRLFCTAPAGEARAHRKQALMHFILKKLDEA